MKAFATALVLVLVAAAAAQGQGGKIDCKSGDLNQGQLNQCAGAELRTAEAALDALYRTMTAKYDVANQALLAAGQKAWAAYRDAECAFETNPTAGGSIHGMMLARCAAAKTSERIRELQRQAKCGEGDISCNRPG